jgi:hypothetical protein
MKIEIPVNRKRVPFAIIIGLLAILILSTAIVRDPHNSDSYYLLPAFIALLIYVFFLTILSFLDYIKTLFDKNARLTISDTEFQDDLSIFSIGKIPWSDISNVELVKALKVDILIVKLLDNEKYLAGKNIFQRHILKKYVKKWGTLLVIPQTRVEFDLKELKEIISGHIH